MSFSDAAQRRLPESLFALVARNRVQSGEIADWYTNGCVLRFASPNLDIPIYLRRVKDGMGSALAYLPEPTAETIQAWTALTGLRERAQAVLDALAAAPSDAVVDSFTRDIKQSIAIVDEVLGRLW